MTKEEIQQYVEQAKIGDEASFMALYHHFLPVIFGYCYQQIGHKQQTEDVVAESFLAMAKGIKQYQGDASFKNWLFSIVKRKVADFWRQHRPTMTLIEDKVLFLEHEDELEEETVNPLKTLLLSIIEQLPTHYQQLIQLRFFQQYSVREVAERMKITTNNVKVLQHRAIKKCIECKKELSYDE